MMGWLLRVRELVVKVATPLARVAVPRVTGGCCGSAASTSVRVPVGVMPGLEALMVKVPG